LPDGAPLEVRVRGVSHVGLLRDGGIEVNGVWYATPSAASMAVRNVQSWNGWTDWHYRGETLDQLRRKLAAMPEQTTPGPLLTSRGMLAAEISRVRDPWMYV